jgi:hypothetical protein
MVLPLKGSNGREWDSCCVVVSQLARMEMPGTGRNEREKRKEDE